ncbi:MAG: zinc-binding dehydrogenase [Leadbetterella sp.]|nr:zinc-binding dehydrogenase [Leadbetterella sp.]
MPRPGVRSDWKCAGVSGPVTWLNYEEEVLRDRINEITGRRGVDLVLDMVGGRFPEPAVRSLARGGKYLVTGFASGEIPAVPLNLVLLKEAEIKGVFWGRFSREEPLKQQENIEEIFRYYAEDRIRPYIGREYLLEEAVQALQNYRDRKVTGKTVVICDLRLTEQPAALSTGGQ